MDKTARSYYNNIRKNRTSDKKSKGKKNGGLIIVSEYDGVIFATVIILLLIGVLMVFSSSYYVAMVQDKGMFYYFSKQAGAAVLGVCGMIIVASINYRTFMRFSFIMYILSNGLLIYTRYFGRLANGARRWIDIPVFGSFQPSEFSKMAVILFLAHYIYKKRDRLKTLTGFLGASIIILIPATLAYVCTKSLSSALTIVSLGFGMIFIASPYFWRFIVMVGLGIGGMVLYLNLPISEFRGARFVAWQDPFSDPLRYGYQTIQSLYAVASGGLFGLGLGNSNQKLIYMPEPHNDFIFAIICEELGFVGACIILLLFSFLIWRGIKVALNAPDLLGTLMASGIVIMVSVQVIINVGVVTNTIPNTGIPLPFISAGGTSVLFIMALMGILLNISRYSKDS